MSLNEDTYKLTEEEIQGIRDAFNYYDCEGTGHIPSHRLSDIMRNLGHNLGAVQLKELVDMVDTDRSGSIEWEEFLPLMAYKLKEKEEHEFYKDMFRILDKKKQGFIPVDDLRYILRGLADQVDITQDEIEEMISAVDEDGDGTVSFEEFYGLMTC